MSDARKRSPFEVARSDATRTVQKRLRKGIQERYPESHPLHPVLLAKAEDVQARLRGGVHALQIALADKKNVVNQLNWSRSSTIVAGFVLEILSEGKLKANPEVAQYLLSTIGPEYGDEQFETIVNTNFNGAEESATESVYVSVADMLRDSRITPIQASFMFEFCKFGEVTEDWEQREKEAAAAVGISPEALEALDDIASSWLGIG